MTPLIPEIKLSPTTLEFGTVTVGTSLEKKAKIENLGTADLIVTDISLCTATSSEFSWSPNTLPLMVAPGSSADLAVVYTPVDEVGDTGCLQITSNDPYAKVSTLTLTGTGALPRPDINLSLSALNFGFVRVGTPTTLTSQIQNLGTADLAVTNISLCTGTSNEFSWSPNTFPLTVSPGSSLMLSVIYTPRNVGTDNGCLQITSNDLSTPAVYLSLTGAAQPVINLSPSTLNFGSGVSTPATLSTQIQNLGTADLIISDIALCPGTSQEFTWRRTRLPFTVVPGGSATLSVIYTPVNVGTDTGCLAIRSNDPAANLTNLALVGTGAIDVTVESFSATLKCIPKTANSIYVEFTLQVTNNTPVKGVVSATLVGVRYGIEIYNQSITVSPPPNKRKPTTYSSFPSFYPFLSGIPNPLDIYTISWTVTTKDTNPDSITVPTTPSRKCLQGY